MTIKQLPISIPRGFWSEYGVRGKYTAIAFICFIIWIGYKIVSYVI